VDDSAPANRSGFGTQSRWRRVIVGALRESTTDRVALAAAGCAFYATLALFPAITVLISLYGLAFNVSAVEQQLGTVRELMPAPAFELIDNRVRELVSQPSGALSLGLVVGIVLAFWSASAGTKSVISALNVAYDSRESRSIIGFQLMGLSMTLCAIIAAGLAISVLVLLPAMISFVGLSHYSATLINALSMALLVVLVGGTTALLYRYGPCRRKPPRRVLLHGSLLSTALWLIASVGLSFYVSHLASFGATYGPLGAVVAIMLWFYFSAYAVLLGAELNAQLELSEPA
jgi:membrane protein